MVAENVAESTAMALNLFSMVLGISVIIFGVAMGIAIILSIAMCTMGAIEYKKEIQKICDARGIKLFKKHERPEISIEPEMVEEEQSGSEFPLLTSSVQLDETQDYTESLTYELQHMNSEEFHKRPEIAMYVNISEGEDSKMSEDNELTPLRDLQLDELPNSVDEEQAPDVELEPLEQGHVSDDREAVDLDSTLSEPTELPLVEAHDCVEEPPESSEEPFASQGPLSEEGEEIEPEPEVLLAELAEPAEQQDEPPRQEIAEDDRDQLAGNSVITQSNESPEEIADEFSAKDELEDSHETLSDEFIGETPNEETSEQEDLEKRAAEDSQ